MKILFAIHTFFPKWRAGTEVYTLNLAKALKKHGHEVQVVCYEPTAGASSEVKAIDEPYDGVPVHRILFNQGHPDSLLHEYFNPQVEKHLVEFYGRVRPDVVHVIHSMHLSAATLTAAERLGLPVVCTTTDFWYICPTYRLLRVDDSICPGPVNFLQCAQCYAVSKRKWKAHLAAALGRSDRLARVFKDAVESLTTGPGLSSRPKLRKLQQIIERPRRLREILSQVDVLIVPNEHTLKVLVENGITARRVLVLGFGLSLPSEVHASKKSSGKLRLAYIGNLTNSKGAHVVVEAMRRLAEHEGVEFAVYGDPQIDLEYFLHLKNIAGSDRRIKFAGTFRNEDIGEIFSEIDLLVIPSLWYENTPLVLYSAFATKTPVVVSKVGSLAGAVRHGENGLVFEMGNPEDLARQIQRVLDDRSLLEKLRQGIPPVESIEQNAQELLEIYAALTIHPAIAKPKLEVTSLSKWLESVRSDHSSPANRVGLLERATIRSAFRRRARFGENLELWRCQYASEGRQLNLRFVWKYVRSAGQDLNIVVQFLDDHDATVFRADHQLSEFTGQNGFHEKDVVAYCVSLQIPEQLAPGSYGVCLGVWDPSEQRFVAPTAVRGWREEASQNIRLRPIRVQ